MAVMNVVWPVTALYSGPLGIIAYYTIGRKKAKNGMMKKEKGGMMMHGDKHMMMHHQHKTPVTWETVVKGCLHCGSGCTIGDMLASLFLLSVPVILFGSKLYGGWLVEFVFAFIAGIIFQYYAIKPMRQLSPGQALVAALKADTLSLISWQVGMYGWMAICTFVLFNRQLEAGDPLFWCMMQVGMLAGLITSYPVNWFLLKKGIKEAM